MACVCWQMGLLREGKLPAGCSVAQVLHKLVHGTCWGVNMLSVRGVSTLMSAGRQVSCMRAGMAACGVWPPAECSLAQVLHSLTMALAGHDRAVAVRH